MLERVSNTGIQLLKTDFPHLVPMQALLPGLAQNGAVLRHRVPKVILLNLVQGLDLVSVGILNKECVHISGIKNRTRVPRVNTVYDPYVN